MPKNVSREIGSYLSTAPVGRQDAQAWIMALDLMQSELFAEKGFLYWLAVQGIPLSRHRSLVPQSLVIPAMLSCSFRSLQFSNLIPRNG